MMLAHELRLAAAALSLGVMAFLAPAEARGFGGFRAGMSGFHGATVRGFGHIRNPAVFMHPSTFRSPLLNGRDFVSRQFFRHRLADARRIFVRRRFANDRRFLFRRDRFEGPFAIGFVGAGYSSAYATYPDDQGITQTSPLYDSAYATSMDDQSVTQTSPLYDNPYNFGRVFGGGCSLLIEVEKSGDRFVNRRIPLC